MDWIYMAQIKIMAGILCRRWWNFDVH